LWRSVFFVFILLQDWFTKCMSWIFILYLDQIKSFRLLHR
jgi:hypothetical protein